jgi:hypothetical protein
MKKLLLILASASLTFASGCGSKDSAPAPTPTTPTVVGSWSLITEQTETTPASGSSSTAAKAYPAGLYKVVYTDTSFQGYINNVAQGTPSTYSISGTTYTFQDGNKTRTAQIIELSATRFVTAETYKNGTSTVVLTDVLTR